MAIPAKVEHEEYGSINAGGSSRRATRILMVAGAISMCMAATIFFGNSSTNSFETKVELEILTPEKKLERIVNDMAVHSSKMTIEQMESKLKQWRNDPNTLLDLPQAARTQVTCKPLELSHLSFQKFLKNIEIQTKHVNADAFLGGFWDLRWCGHNLAHGPVHALREEGYYYELIFAAPEEVGCRGTYPLLVFSVSKTPDHRGHRSSN